MGFEDECWWSRVALPTLNSLERRGEPLRLVQRSVAKDDPEPKAISCYGLYLPETRRDVAEIRGRQTRELHNDAVPLVVLREARSGGQEVPASHLGQRFLAHLQRAQALARQTQPPQSKRAAQGVRIVSCLLPKQSPWLNAIEPKWVHGKRKVVEFEGFSEHTSWPTGFAGFSVVRITSISPFPRRSPDHALVHLGKSSTPVCGIIGATIAKPHRNTWR